jgi:hypothetical protein
VRKPARIHNKPRFLSWRSSSQPFVLKYVTEALLEESDPSLSLTEEESGLIFLTLKTVIDALDEACAG